MCANRLKEPTVLGIFHSKSKKEGSRSATIKRRSLPQVPGGRETNKEQRHNRQVLDSRITSPLFPKRGDSNCVGKLRRKADTQIMCIGFTCVNTVDIDR